MLGQETAVLLLLCVGLLMLMAAVTNGAGFSLDGIKGRTVGDGQHGTARFAGKGEIRRTFHRVRFRPRAWRRGKHLPKVQGLVVGCEMRGKRVTALVDGDDIHAMMVAGSGAGKTAYFLYPNLEYCCAAGMSFLTSDTKGDLARNYAGIAKDIYGYDVSVLDLRCCFSKRMRKLFIKNEKSVLRFCNKSSKTKRAFTKVLMPCKRPF